MTDAAESPAASQAQREARARLRLLLDVTDWAWVQIGKLEVLYGADSDQPEAEDLDPIQCLRCGVTSERRQWRSSEDRSCPFCHKSRLP
jgi:hypothetical protein